MTPNKVNNNLGTPLKQEPNTAQKKLNIVLERVEEEVGSH